MLNGKQKRLLRGLANPIKPITQIGKDGLSMNFYKSIEDAFNTHELIKVNILKTCELDPNLMAIEICANCHCEFVQKIGRTFVFYKKAKEPKIIL